MLISVLFSLILVGGCGLILYMVTHGENDIVHIVEAEVAGIRRQAERGWSTRRILRHHHGFCACQIEYLRRRTYRPV